MIHKVALSMIHKIGFEVIHKIAFHLIHEIAVPDNDTGKIITNSCDMVNAIDAIVVCCIITPSERWRNLCFRTLPQFFSQQI